MRNDKFTRTLHRRAVIRELQQLLLTKYVVVDEKAKQQLLCEEAPYVDRFVSQEALSDVVAILSTLEQEEDKRLLRFEFREKEEVVLPESLKEKEDVPEEKATRAPRRRRGGSSDPSPASSP